MLFYDDNLQTLEPGTELNQARENLLEKAENRRIRRIWSHKNIL